MDRDGEIKARGYIRRTAAAVVLVLCAVAIFNAFVDPFRMYDLVVIPGFNAFKPEIYQRVRVLKAFEVRRVKPRGLVLGTSRTHIAIDPAHGGWDPRATPRYNLAFDAATTREMYRYLLHAEATRPLVQVLLGLEYYHLNESPSGTNPGFDPGLLRDPRSAIALPLFLRADLKVLTTMDTLEAAVETIQSQGHPPPDWFAPDGRRLGRIYFLRPGSEYTRIGPRAFFEQFMETEAANKIETIERNQASLPEPVPPGEARMKDSSLGWVIRIVEFCHTRDIDLRIFISPVHANEIELAAAVGEYPSIEDGKRLLVRMLDEHAARRPGAPPVPVFDFSGYNAVTTEPLPPPGSGQPMKHYWDPSHAKKHVGDFIQDRVFGVSDPRGPVPSDFGVSIDARNIDAVLAGMRADQRDYRDARASEITDIRALVQRIRRERMAGGKGSRAAAH